MYIVNFTSDDFKSNLKKSDLVIIPVGMVEAHGHHMPLGTDIFSPRLFCSMIEKIIGDKVWIAPEIPFGQSFDLSFYPGTFSVPSEVLAEYVFHIGKSMLENGLKKLIFLNGHGGNVTALSLASQRLVELGMDVMISNWWVDYSKEILTITEGQGHAGEDETSAILYYDEELVQMDKATKNNKKPLLKINFKERGKVLYENALSGDATLATKEKGKKIFRLLTDRMIEAILLIRDGKYYIEE
ncbi:MAG: Creatininase [Clostridiales bacterium]|jgi:creatinine amidohydrolase|nr:Creatininase [Clostridiales bacterium]